MYCVKCGKELPDDAQFCSGCGTKVGGGKRNIELPSIDLSSLKKIGETKQVEGVKKGMKILQPCKWLFFGGIIGLIVSLFFLGAEMFEVSFEAFWSTHTESFTMFEGKDFFKVLFILGYIAAAGMLLLPLITGKRWELSNFYLALGVPVLAVIVLIFVMIAAKSGMADSDLMQAVDATAKLTANGWLFIILNALTIGLVVKSNLVIADEQDKLPEEEEEKEEVPPQPYWCAMCGEEGPFEDGCTKCGSRSKVFFKDDVVNKK